MSAAIIVFSVFFGGILFAALTTKRLGFGNAVYLATGMMVFAYAYLATNGYLTLPI